MLPEQEGIQSVPDAHPGHCQDEHRKRGVDQFDEAGKKPEAQVQRDNDGGWRYNQEIDPGECRGEARPVAGKAGVLDILQDAVFWVGERVHDGIIWKFRLSPPSIAHSKKRLSLEGLSAFCLPAVSAGFRRSRCRQAAYCNSGPAAVPENKNTQT